MRFEIQSLVFSGEKYICSASDLPKYTYDCQGDKVLIEEALKLEIGHSFTWCNTHRITRLKGGK